MGKPWDMSAKVSVKASKHLRRILVLLLFFVTALVTSSWVPAAASTQTGDYPWSWPTGSPAAVTAPFNPPPKPWNPGHRGVDLAVAVGEPIFSPARGTVVFAGPLVDRPVVSVLHANGLRSTYEPVTAAVEVGQVVLRGELLGTVAESLGATTHVGLHWGARFGPNEYIDPLRMLVGPSILKPVEGL